METALARERLNDKLRAEDMATNYCDLFVERGKVIHATRNFRALSFRDILERHKLPIMNYTYPRPVVGETSSSKPHILVTQSRRR